MFRWRRDNVSRLDSRTNVDRAAGGGAGHGEGGSWIIHAHPWNFNIFRIFLKTHKFGQFWLQLIFYILNIHQLLLKKIAALVETTRDRATATVNGGSTVFSVQMHAIG